MEYSQAATKNVAASTFAEALLRCRRQRHHPLRYLTRLFLAELRVAGHQGPAPFAGSPVANLSCEVVHCIGSALVAGSDLVKCGADIAPVYPVAANAVGGVDGGQSGCQRGWGSRRSCRYDSAGVSCYGSRILNRFAFAAARLQRTPPHHQHACNDHHYCHDKCRCKPTRPLRWGVVFRVHVGGLWRWGARVWRESHGMVRCGASGVGESAAATGVAAAFLRAIRLRRRSRRG